MELKRITLNFKERNDDYQTLTNLLTELNSKDFGNKISMLDLTMAAVKRLTTKDIEQIKQSSISPRERIELTVKQYNEKNNCFLSVDEYICRQLKI